MSTNKYELFSMGSNQINVDGNVVSQTSWEGYSQDGKKMNLNYYNNGEEAKIRNLNLNDFGFLLRNSLRKEDSDISKIKRNLDPLSAEFKRILKKRKKNDSISIQRRKTKKDRKKSSKGKYTRRKST
tara:strand:- start:11334 stop:11714 length:381 start_codon:yes stop_codon:yes gene_type:complete